MWSPPCGEKENLATDSREESDVNGLGGTKFKFSGGDLSPHQSIYPCTFLQKYSSGRRTAVMSKDKVSRPSLRKLPVLPEFEKDLPRTFNFSEKKSSAVLFEATAQPSKQTLNKRKKIPPLSRMTRADMEKYMALRVVETELRDQNQLLEVAQQQLKQELKMAKDQTEELTARTKSLQSEKEILIKRLQNCTTVLENNLIDPVSANRIIEEHDQKNACRRDVMVNVENLLAELQMLGKFTEEKRERFQVTRLKLENAKEESARIVQETDLIQKDLEEWRISLNQSKQLLHPDFECAYPCDYNESL
ncbi:uncharacterized protein [Chiloscyllium punctatum]|uniref:uncharacterized protein isoform X2 n=1 Tax=Chiloscyllium punctatum TaxID=137246 RepID=UPI003B63732D